MGKWGKIATFYIILIVSFVGLYILLLSLSNQSADIRDVTLTIGGGVLGGLCYALFEKAFIVTDAHE